MGERNDSAKPAGQARVVQLWLAIDDVAAQLRVSTATVRRWTSARRMPQPVRIARTVRWNAAQIELFANAREGMPIAEIGESPSNRISQPEEWGRLTKRGPGRGVVKRRTTSSGKVVWYGDWRGPDGKRHRVDFGSTRAEAEQLLAKAIRDRDLERAGMTNERGVAMTWEELSALYIASLRASTIPSTPVVYARRLERIQHETGWRVVRDITRDGFMAWREKRCSSGSSNRTVNEYLIVLRAALNHAVDRGRLGANPLRGLEKLPEKGRYARRRARPLEEHECARLLAQAAVDDAKRGGIPQRPLLLTLMEVGQRITETTLLTWGDFNSTAKVLRFRSETAKGERDENEDLVPLAAVVVRELVELRAIQARQLGRVPAAGDRIFLGRKGRRIGAGQSAFKAWYHRIVEEAGFERVDGTGRHLHLHALRHTFSTRVMKAGIHPSKGKLLTRHKSEKVLLGYYTHANLEDARNAIECLRSIEVVGNVSTAPGSADLFAPQQHASEQRGS